MRVGKGRNQKQRRLTPADIGYIKRAYEMNVSAIEVAKIFDVSERCIRERYQGLRGYPLKSRQLEKSLSVKRKEHKGYLSREKWEQAQRAAALYKEEISRVTRKRNEARFYHSDFIPS